MMSNTELYAQPGRSKKELVVGDYVYKSANDWEITDIELRRAGAELGETKEKIERGLRKLKELLSEDSNVKYRTDDAYLLRFLRFRKFDVEKAYQNIKQFNYLKNLKSDAFTLPSNLKTAQDMDLVTYFPYTDEEGRMLVCINLASWNPNEKSFEEICQTGTTVADIIAMNPKTQINGILAIYDVKTLSVTHMTEMLRKNRLYAFFTFAQNGYPWRLKKVLVINTSRTMRLLYQFIRPLIKKKIADRVVFIGSDMSELHKYINPVLLPERYGGTLQDEECNVTQHVLDNLPFLKYERSFISE